MRACVRACMRACACGLTSSRKRRARSSAIMCCVTLSGLTRAIFACAPPAPLSAPAAHGQRAQGARREPAGTILASSSRLSASSSAFFFCARSGTPAVSAAGPSRAGGGRRSGAHRLGRSGRVAFALSLLRASGSLVHPLGVLLLWTHARRGPPWRWRRRWHWRWGWRSRRAHLLDLLGARLLLHLFLARATLLLLRVHAELLGLRAQAVSTAQPTSHEDGQRIAHRRAGPRPRAVGKRAPARREWRGGGWRATIGSHHLRVRAGALGTESAPQKDLCSGCFSRGRVDRPLRSHSFRTPFQSSTPRCSLSEEDTHKNIALFKDTLQQMNSGQCGSGRSSPATYSGAIP